MFQVRSKLCIPAVVVVIVAILDVISAHAAETSSPNTPIVCPPAPCQQLQQCDWQHDTRNCYSQEDCSRCLVSAFGHCIQQGNDPVCEARKAAGKASCETAKAAQNAAYDAAHSACVNSVTKQKVACEALQAFCDAASQNGTRQ
jgi:hypothetical protein